MQIAQKTAANSLKQLGRTQLLHGHTPLKSLQQQQNRSHCAHCPQWAVTTLTALELIGIWIV